MLVNDTFSALINTGSSSSSNGPLLAQKIRGQEIDDLILLLLLLILALGYTIHVFNNGCMTMTFQILKVHEVVEGQAKDESCV